MAREGRRQKLNRWVLGLLWSLKPATAMGRPREPACKTLCRTRDAARFITEPMFARQADASKVGFATLSHYLKRWGFVLNDGKRDSSHLR